MLKSAQCDEQWAGDEDLLDTVLMAVLRTTSTIKLSGNHKSLVNTLQLFLVIR